MDNDEVFGDMDLDIEPKPETDEDADAEEADDAHEPTTATTPSED